MVGGRVLLHLGCPRCLSWIMIRRSRRSSKNQQERQKANPSARQPSRKTSIRRYTTRSKKRQAQTGLRTMRRRRKLRWLRKNILRSWVLISEPLCSDLHLTCTVRFDTTVSAIPISLVQSRYLGTVWERHPFGDHHTAGVIGACRCNDDSALAGSKGCLPTTAHLETRRIERPLASMYSEVGRYIYLCLRIHLSIALALV